MTIAGDYTITVAAVPRGLEDQMNLQSFITECKLPEDWEEVVCLEALTGCTACERRLIHDEKLRGGTLCIRMREPKTLVLQGLMVLCKECAAANKLWS